jgi:hypothetical protein
MSVPTVHFTNPDDLAHVLERLRDVIVRHPIAAQAAFSALAHEGRRFAETEEGKVWKDRLVASELLGRVRLIWNCLGMHTFVEQPVDVLPSFFLDGAVRAASLQGLEPFLSAIFDEPT